MFQLTHTIQRFSAPLGRFLIGILFVQAGLGKVFSYAGTADYMLAMGVPSILLPLVIIAELGGGLAVIFGYHTRIAAFALAGFCVLTAVLFHADFSDTTQMIMFSKNMALAGGFLFLVAHGAGALSLDNKVK
ncbi:DoxX family protein [Moritella sp. F3]|uniref:DoxX family protein n=1 Tax=Moritella sp. F3 TaxID=2718882 RepID=UPI0018E162CB|nr:DoxX family protein [Moritella sp. F3]GIC77957.1 membrane protein [Moritella sp. F1]GIC82354.1 membrane protein [Moritella sp. F3]